MTTCNRASADTRRNVMVSISHAMYLIYHERETVSMWREDVITPEREGNETQTGTQLCTVAFSSRLEFGNLIVCATNLMCHVPHTRLITNVTIPDTCYY